MDSWNDISCTTKGTLATIFVVGLFVMAILSMLGMVYLSKMAYSPQKQPNGQYVGNLSETERNIARFSILVLWVLITWVVLGTFLQPLWKKSC